MGRTHADHPLLRAIMVRRHCDICWKAVREENYEDHLNTHDRLTCPECYKDFSSQTKYGLHMRQHMRRPTYCCNICSKSFPDHISLVRHQRTHLEVVTFPCFVCQLAFTQKNLLKNHLRKAHGIEGKDEERTGPLIIDISEERAVEDNEVYEL